MSERPLLLRPLFETGYMELPLNEASQAGCKPWAAIDTLQNPKYFLVAEIPADVPCVGPLLRSILTMYIAFSEIAAAQIRAGIGQRKSVLRLRSPPSAIADIAMQSPPSFAAQAHHPDLPLWLEELLPDLLERPSPLLVVAEPGSGKEELVQAFLKAKYSARNMEAAIFFHPGRLAQAVQLRELFGDAAGARLGGAGASVPIIERSEPVIVIQEAGDLDNLAQLRLFAHFNTGATPQKLWIFETSRDLRQMARAERFLDGLCEMLWQNAVTLPPLRNCREYLASEIERLMFVFRAKYRRDARLDQEAIVALERYNWPGNWRELCNTLESAFLMVTSGVIQSSDLHLGRWATPEDWDDLNLRKHSKLLEKALLLRAYALHAGNQVHMARALGISRGSLQYKLEKHKLN